MTAFLAGIEANTTDDISAALWQKDDKIINKYKNSHIFSGRYRLRPDLSIVRDGEDEVCVPWAVLHIPAMETWHCYAMFLCYLDGENHDTIVEQLSN